MSNTFDVIVIGAGAVGEVLAGRTAASGLSTAIIERERAGGECSYWACIPSKALLKPESVMAAARRVQGASSAVTGDIDSAAVLKFRDKAVNDYDDTSQVKWIEDSGITFFRGTGRISGERTVTVSSEAGEQHLTANKAVVVATGSSAAVPPIEGLSSVDYWTSRDATSSKQVPRRLGIIGGGTVAVEMAQAWKSLGTEEVTLLVRGSRLVEREEPFASAALLKSFAEQGIDVRFQVNVTSVAKSGDAIDVFTDTHEPVTVDKLLVAIGRRPNTADIGLDVVGLEPGKYISVDDRLRATDVDGDWLYSVGDANGRALLTHQGKYQARIASDVIAGKSAEAWADTHAVPGVTFTEPQIASVGLRAEAASKSMRTRELSVPWTSAAGAFVSGITEGTAQIVIDEDRRVIVGATFVGPEAGEMLQAATNAIAGEVTIDKLWHAVPAYPTVSEVWLRLLEAYGL